MERLLTFTTLEGLAPEWRFFRAQPRAPQRHVRRVSPLKWRIVSRRGLWIFAIILAWVLGLVLYRARCRFFLFSETVRLESGSAYCTLLDVEPLSAQFRNAQHVPNYSFGLAEFEPDSHGDGGTLRLALRVTVDPPVVIPPDFSYRAVLPDAFRIHFRQPATMEELAPDRLKDLQPPTGHLNYGGKIAGASEFRRIKHWHPLNWFDSTFGERAVFRDGAFNYESSGKGYGIEFALYSPNEDFVALGAGDNDHDCAAYLEIYRRRDHRQLAKIRVDSCGFDTGLVLGSRGWVSERDFLFITGAGYSQCVICRFEK